MAEMRHLRYFVAVAERLSFSRAAVDLNLSQATLSESVRRLENELGTPLLVRSTRQVTLTAAGEALLPEALELAARFDRALERARRLGAHEGVRSDLRD